MHDFKIFSSGRRDRELDLTPSNNFSRSKQRFSSRMLNRNSAARVSQKGVRLSVLFEHECTFPSRTLAFRDNNTFSKRGFHEAIQQHRAWVGYVACGTVNRPGDGYFIDGIGSNSISFYSIRFRTANVDANAEIRDITFYDEPGTLVIGAHFNSSDGVDRSFDRLISIAHWYVPTGLLQPLLDLPGPAPFNIATSAGTPAEMELNVLSDLALLYDIGYNIKTTMRISGPKDLLFQGPMERTHGRF